jgi:hypothetical protein
MAAAAFMAAAGIIDLTRLLRGNSASSIFGDWLGLERKLKLTNGRFRPFIFYKKRR